VTRATAFSATAVDRVGRHP